MSISTTFGVGRRSLQCNKRAVRIRKNPVLDIFRSVCWNPLTPTPMRQIPKTELSPDNGCVIDTKGKVGPLSYHACAATEAEHAVAEGNYRLPELVIYDHAGFKGAYART